MKYGERDGSGRFAKKEVLGNNATQENDADTGTTEEQEQGEVQVLYCDSIKGIGATVDKALASLGLAGVGTEVEKALAVLNIAGLR